MADVGTKKYKCLFCKQDPNCGFCKGKLVSKKEYKEQQEFAEWCKGMEEYEKRTSLWS